MRISVIVPFLNEATYIERCLQALLEQRFARHEYEIIFIDNGSRDRSADIVRRYPQVTLLQEPRRGSYVARNTGLSQARGAYLAFTDADCAPAPDWLAHIDRHFHQSDAALVLGRRLFPVERGPLKWFEEYENIKTQYVLNRCPIQKLIGFTNNMALTRQVMVAVGPFLDQEGADIDYVQRCAARFRPRSVVYAPDMIVTHLEVKRVATWLGKQMRYGRDMQHFEHALTHRPLDLSDRLHIYRACASAHHAAGRQPLAQLLALFLGGLCFETGRGWARLEALWQRPARHPA